MPRIRKLLLTLSFSTVLLATAASGQAFASHSQLTYFEGSQELLSAKTRPHAFVQLQSLGVKALRIELHWAAVAPAAASATKPSFEATNPGIYAWGAYDAVIAEAKRLHWQVLLTITAPVPRWATSNKKAPYITRPDDKDFKEFMTAVARHFGSTVSLFSIWNEPNHPAFLLPQWNSNGTPASPRIYRGLYQAGYEGLQAGGPGTPERALRRDRTDGIRQRQEPAAQGKIPRPAARRRAAGVPARSVVPELPYRKAGSCGELQITGYAHHAYTRPSARRTWTAERDDVEIGSLSRLSNALNLAARAHAIPGGVPIYLTEFGVQSKPNKYLGVSPAQQAEYDAMAEHIAWSNPRVAAFSQYLLKDDPLGGAPGASVHGGSAGFQTGLEYLNGARKPLYFGWPIPLTVSKQRARLLAVGSRAPGHRRHEGDDPRAPRGLQALQHAEDPHHRQQRLLEPELLHARAVLARSLDEPLGREVRRAADPGPLASGWDSGIALRWGDAGAARGRDHRATARRGADAERRSSRRWRRASTR